MKKSAAYEAGLAVRKKVLGPDYVEQTLKNADELLLPFQELLTEFAWGSVWTRAGLDLKTRSMLTLAMCIALNRPHEIKLHLRGALRNGCTVIEIRELLLHSFIYCGGPAAVDAFNVIRTALPEIQALEKEARSAAKKSAPAPTRKAATKGKK
jgi:4-carboxymuconolactone decarboxylase